MNDHPVVSVVLPAYNASRFLVAALQSVIAQDYANLEIIIVNDGSTDDTDEIIQSWLPRDPRIKYLKHEANRGLPAARNTGLTHSTGAIIAFLDADDLWQPDKITKQLTKLPEADMVFSNAKLIDETGRPLGTSFWDYIRVTPARGRQTLVRLFRKNFIIPASSIIFKKTVSDKIGLFDERLKSIEDYDFTLRAISAGCCLDFVDEELVSYRLNQSQMSGNLRRMEYWRIFVLGKFLVQHPALAFAHPVLAISRLGKRALALIYKTIFQK